MAQTENYTQEMTDFAIATYQAAIADGATNQEAIDEVLADERFEGKNARSVRSKLSREGVYVKQEAKPKAPKAEGPSKKEMIKQLQELTGRDLEGIDNATKGALQELIDFFSDDEVEDAADDFVPDETVAA